MIRMIQSNAAQAKSYFKDQLSQADYYLDGQELNGKIQGKLAERLGIVGPVTKDAFFALCDNKHPDTGERITPRTKEERRTGFDINFHCPKSVSVVNALSDDGHIRIAFVQAVQETMRDIEADVMARVRKDGAFENRTTGELMWADFLHLTSRPVDGSVPDPHLHAHCFAFNATWDTVEKRCKAGEFVEVKRSMPYYQAAFHLRLADKLLDLGYQVRRTEKSFEIEGVPKEVVALFSKRSDAIGRFAKEHDITDARELDGLGARTRAKKQKGLSMSELKAEWRLQIQDLGTQGQGGNQDIRFAAPKDLPVLSPKQCVEHALLDGFERASVQPERRLLAAAFRHGIGNRPVTVETIQHAFKTNEEIIHVKEKRGTMCTTRQVLGEERAMAELARQGQGKLLPLYLQVPLDIKLEGQQRAAAEHVLTTPHRVSIIRGAAGTGKTTLMHEVVRHIEAAGKQVTVVAPTSEASRGVLRGDGFVEAETVALLLKDKDMQAKLQGGVLMVDEAGLLGTKDMTALLSLATQYNARCILVGDTRQHAAVVRGDALRILNTVAGIPVAEVSKIHRQKNEYYKRAVEHLSTGQVREAFDKLDAMGAIQSVDKEALNDALVTDYMKAVTDGKSALIVSPTHEQGEKVTEALRDKLRDQGLIGEEETQVWQYRNRNLTEAEKTDWRCIESGQLIQFNQNVKGVKRGSLWRVLESKETGIQMESDTGQIKTLPIVKGSDYDVLERKALGLSTGDHVRLTRNGFDAQGKRLNNGQTAEVVSTEPDGTVRLRSSQSKTEFELPAGHGHLAHAYCITSYAAQGKTVDEVFIAQPAATFAATDAKQFYVSVSRGRERCTIYTDDKKELLENAAELNERQSAIELVEGKRDPATEMAQQQIRQDMLRVAALAEKAKDSPAPQPTFEHDYVPV